MRSLAGPQPGSPRNEPAGIVAKTPSVSFPVKELKISAPAAEKMLCPEKYSAKGGVTVVASWYGRHWEAGMNWVP